MSFYPPLVVGLVVGYNVGKYLGGPTTDAELVTKASNYIKQGDIWNARIPASQLGERSAANTTARRDVCKLLLETCSNTGHCKDLWAVDYLTAPLDCGSYDPTFGPRIKELKKQARESMDQKKVDEYLQRWMEKPDSYMSDLMRAVREGYTKSAEPNLTEEHCIRMAKEAMDIKIRNGGTETPVYLCSLLQDHVKRYETSISKEEFASWDAILKCPPYMFSSFIKKT